MPRVTERRFPFLPLDALRRVALVIGAIGALWSIIETLVALDVLGDGTPLSPFDGRESTAIGLVTLALTLAAIAGAALTLRVPSATASLLFVAACGGFLAVGAPWIIPGTLLAVASWLALLSTPNPFEEELDRERAAEDAREASATKA